MDCYLAHLRLLKVYPLLSLKPAPQNSLLLNVVHLGFWTSEGRKLSDKDALTSLLVLASIHFILLYGFYHSFPNIPKLAP